MKYFFISCLLFCNIIISTVYSQNNAETYNLLIDKSTIEWEGRKVIGAHNGNVKLSYGKLLVQNNLIQGGEFTADMTTIKDNDLDDKEYNDKLVNHLKSEDFFNVSKYPKSTFVITKTEPYKDNINSNINIKITGDLIIKGIKNSISFPAIVRRDSKGIIGRAKFSIDRTKWNIKYKSASIFSGLEDKFIYDDIRFIIDLYFTK